ncbi:MAG: L-threonylcarbamoyladenylate synthase [Patescibacteria group bacterium]
MIKNNELGVIPTDTLYGLVGSAFSPKAVEKIYQLKKRDPSKPLIVLITSWLDLEKFGAEISPAGKKNLKKIWPGPVSVILPAKNKKFTYLHRGTQTIAFRWPRNEQLQKILKKTGPLVAPSANPEGLPPATTVAEAKKYFGRKIDFYKNGGKITGKPSTLIKLQNGKIEIIRGCPLDAKKKINRRA